MMLKKINEMNKLTRYIIYLSVAVVALFVLPFFSWLIGEESFTATSHAEFCASCHTMQPYSLANADNNHGGNNEYGIKASCTTCHLPHDNSANYLYTKARTGIHDIWVETFTDTSKIDWRAKTEHREEFVYDSGCLSCHVELEKATQDEEEHKKYFAGETTSQCVTCHEEVGHSNINKYLLQNKYNQ